MSILVAYAARPEDQSVIDAGIDFALKLDEGPSLPTPAPAANT